MLRHRLVVKRGVSDELTLRVLIESQMAPRSNGSYREEEFEPTRRVFRADSETIGFSATNCERPLPDSNGDTPDNPCGRENPMPLGIGYRTSASPFAVERHSVVSAYECSTFCYSYVLDTAAFEYV